MGNKIKTHYKENNPDSERHLHENEEHFNEQCKKVLTALRKGIVLTMKNAITEFDVGDLRRRIKDLRDINGVTGITDEWVHDDEGKSKYKIWYMPEFAKSKAVKTKPPGVKAPVEIKEPKPAKKKQIAQHNPLFD